VLALTTQPIITERKKCTNEKKRSERRKHRVLAGARSQKICPAADPFPGARDGQNFISWRRSLPSPTDPVWWRSMHAISSYRGNRPTHTHTHTQTNPQTGQIAIHCTAKLSVHCNKWRGWKTFLKLEPNTLLDITNESSKSHLELRQSCSDEYLAKF